MRIVPKPLVERLQFYETKLVRFEENASEIGLTPSEINELRLAAHAARAAFDAQQAAMQTARAATAEFNLAMQALGNIGAGTILRVRAKAQTNSNTNIYPLAGLPTPTKGTPVDEPGKPQRFDVTLCKATGDLLLKWACKNPRGSAGTMYEIHRQVGDGAFERIALVGRRSFRDATIPAGATSIAYRIRAIRSTKTGEANTFVVNFGTNGQTPLPAFGAREAA